MINNLQPLAKLTYGICWSNLLIIMDAYSKMARKCWNDNNYSFNYDQETRKCDCNIVLTKDDRFSSIFKEFCVSNGVEHIWTSTYGPQSNGAIFKYALKKMRREETTEEITTTFIQMYSRCKQEICCIQYYLARWRSKIKKLYLKNGTTIQ